MIDTEANHHGNTHENGAREPMGNSSESPSISQQYAFDLNSEDGAIEPSEESIETSLETFGADVDHRERSSRVAKPEASTFGVDDRPSVTRSDSGEQGALFADTSEDQRTLTGERASAQCLFGNDRNGPSNEEDGETPEISVEERASRAVADGGQTMVGSDPGDH